MEQVFLVLTDSQSMYYLAPQPVVQIQFHPLKDPPGPEGERALRGRLLPGGRLLALLQPAEQGGAGAVHLETAAPVGRATRHLRRWDEQEGRHPGCPGRLLAAVDVRGHRQAGGAAAPRLPARPGAPPRSAGLHRDDPDPPLALRTLGQRLHRRQVSLCEGRITVPFADRGIKLDL